MCEQGSGIVGTRLFWSTVQHIGSVLEELHGSSKGLVSIFVCHASVASEFATFQQAFWKLKFPT